MNTIESNRAFAPQSLEVGRTFSWVTGRRIEQINRLANQLITRVAIYLTGGRVTFDDRPGYVGMMRIDQHNRVRRMRKQDTKPLLALAPRRLGARPLDHAAKLGADMVQHL